MVPTVPLLLIALAVLLQALLTSGHSKPTVTFSFCYISGNVNPPSLLYGAYVSYISGLLNTSATAYKATGSYTLTAATDAQLHLAGSRVPLRATLVAQDDGVYSRDNDNIISIRARSDVATVDGDGLAFRTSEGEIEDYGSSSYDYSDCGSNGLCGVYSALYVQLYDSSAPSMIPCSPLSTATVQLSFCLITGDSEPPSLGVGDYTSYTSGIFNTSSTVYSPDGSYSLTSIVNGQFHNSSSPFALPASLLPPGSYDSNDNVITLQAGSNLAELDRDGLSIVTSVTEQDAYDDDGTGYAGCTDSSSCGGYSVLYVQQYNSSGAVIPCTEQAAVTFSFCLVTGNVDPPSLLYGAYNTYTSGLLSTTTSVYSATGTYTAAAISGGQFHTRGSSSTRTATLATRYGYRDNDNSFTLQQGTSEAIAEGRGLALAVGKTDIDDYYYGGGEDHAICSNQTLCGVYSALYVQLYDSSAPSMIPCSPLSTATVQLSFCLITGGSDPPSLGVGDYTSYTSGIFNTSSTVYSPDGSYSLTSIVNGQFHNSSSPFALPASLLPPGSYDSNDNVITLQAGSNLAELDRDGLSIVTSVTEQDAYDDDGTGYAGCTDSSSCGGYSVLYVQQYNSSGAVIPCTEQAAVTFSFCLVTGNVDPPSLLYGAYNTYTSGLLSTTTSVYSATGTYTAAAISGGQFHTRGSSSTRTATLATRYGYRDNDNSFTLQQGTSEAIAEGRGLALAVGKTDIDDYYYGGGEDHAICSNQTLCGVYSALYVQLYDSSAPSMIPCSPLSTATVQLSFCLITGGSDPPSLGVGDYTSYTSGIFNTSSTVYSPDGSYSLTSIVNGQFHNSSSPFALPASLLPPGSYDSNDNVITLQAGSNLAELDRDGLSIVTSVTEQDAYDDDGTGYAGCTDSSSCGGYSVLYVQQYNSSGAVIPCTEQAAVTFSFCLVTGNVDPPSLLYGAYNTYTSGLLSTTTSVYSATGTYTAAAISGGQFHTRGSSSTRTATLATRYGYRDNDNSFTLQQGTSEAIAEGRGLALAVGKTDIDDYYYGGGEDHAICSNQTLCGVYSALYVQLYDSSAPSMIPCSPLSTATVQLSFCLITGGSDPPSLGVGDYTSYTSGIFNTSSTVYSPDGSYSLTSIVNGQFHNSSSPFALPASLLPPGSYDSNDNVITLQAGSNLAELDRDGLSIVTSVTEQDAYDDDGTGYAGCTDSSSCGGYSVLYVQQYNSSGAVIPCTEQAAVTFSFCLVTGNVDPPSLLYGAYNTYTSGLLSTTTSVYSATGTYTAAAISGGQFHTRGSSSTRTATLATRYGYRDNDNSFTLQQGTSEAIAEGRGLALAVGKTDIDDYYYGGGEDHAICSNQTLCGVYSALYVQLYDSSAPSMIPCSPLSTATVQLSFCLITGGSDPPSLGVGDYTSYTSGIFNTSSTVYSPDGSYSLTSIVNGQFHNSSSPFALPASLLPPGSYDSNDNVITLQAGSNLAELDRDGLSIVTSVTEQDAYDDDGTGYAGCTDSSSCGGYSVLYVQQYNSSGAVIPCTEQAAVTFSFCLVTGNVDPPSLLYGAYNTYTSGLLSTTTSVYSATGTYTAAAISGGQFHTRGSSSTRTATLATRYGYRDNDNSFTLQQGTSEAIAEGRGLALAVGKTDIDDYYYGGGEDHAICSNQTLCGVYSALYVQLYDSSAPSMIPCSPLSTATVQLSFCLITGGSDPPSLGVGDYTSYTSGIFNTSSTVYSPDGSYSLTSIVNGQFHNSSSPFALPASLLPPGSYDSNDNVITLQAGSNLAELDRDGLSIVTSVTEQDAYDDDGTGYAGCTDSSSCGGYSVLYAQQYNSSAPATIPCSPVPAMTSSSSSSAPSQSGTSSPSSSSDRVKPSRSSSAAPLSAITSSSSARGKAGKQSSSSSLSSSTPVIVYSAVSFSFCLVTGPVASPSLSSAGQYLTYTSGIMDTSAQQYSPSGAYTVTAIVGGSFHNSSSAIPHSAVLLKAGAEDGNDNVITLQSGSSQAALDSGGLALSTPVVSMNVNSGGVSCNEGYDCGDYFTLTVQLYNASTGVTVPCSPPQSSSSSGGSVFSSSQQPRSSSTSSPAVHHSSSSPTSSVHHSSSSSRKYVTSSSRRYVTSSSKKFATSSSSRQPVSSSSRRFVTSSSSRHVSSSSSSPSAGSANLLLNGGFETTAFAPAWNVSGSGLSVTCGPVGGYSAHSGSCFALLGAAGNDSALCQSVQLALGTQYSLSLYLAADGGTPSDFSAVYQFSGQTAVTAFSLTDPPASGYQLYSAVIPAQPGSGAINLTLSLLSRDDPGYLALDDISLVRQP